MASEFHRDRRVVVPWSEALNNHEAEALATCGDTGQTAVATMYSFILAFSPAVVRSRKGRGGV